MFLSCCRIVVGGLHLCYFIAAIQSLGDYIFVLSLLHTVVGEMRLCFLAPCNHLGFALWNRVVEQSLAALSMHSCFVSVLSSWTVLCHSLDSVAIFDCWMGIRGRDVHSVPSPVPAAGTMLAYRCL